MLNIFPFAIDLWSFFMSPNTPLSAMESNILLPLKISKISSSTFYFLWDPLTSFYFFAPYFPIYLNSKLTINICFLLKFTPLIFFLTLLVVWSSRPKVNFSHPRRNWFIFKIKSERSSCALMKSTFWMSRFLDKVRVSVLRSKLKSILPSNS